MKKMFMSIVGFLAAAFFTFQALPAHADTWINPSKLKRVYALGTGGFVITLETHDSRCTRKDGYFYAIVGANGVTAEGIKNMLSICLSAYVTGKTVRLNFDETSSDCYINRLFIGD